MEMTNRMEDAVYALEQRVRPQLEGAKRRISDMSIRTKAFIKEHPGKCLLGAGVIGYLIARLARR
jgi:ElaB/YqjD/DUF883 family membrane-anchored ribosome-binding protein